MDSCNLPPKQIQNYNFMSIKDIDYTKLYIFYTESNDFYLKNNSIIQFLKNYDKIDSKKLWFYNLTDNSRDWFYTSDEKHLSFYEKTLEAL